MIIATYLTFFPVTIAVMRGLRSPDPRALELMRSYAASKWAIYWKLRLPAIGAVPVHGAQDRGRGEHRRHDHRRGPGRRCQQGLGRAILTFNQQYITGPEKLWATIVVASVVGICSSSGAVRLVERRVLSRRGLSGQST